MRSRANGSGSRVRLALSSHSRPRAPSHAKVREMILSSDATSWDCCGCESSACRSKSAVRRLRCSCRARTSGSDGSLHRVGASMGPTRGAVAAAPVQATTAADDGRSTSEWPSFKPM
eukprot:1888145-Prymnesium_polylepis.1